MVETVQRAFTHEEVKERTNMQAVYASKSIFYKSVKRILDILLSSIALILLAPVFLIVAVMITIEDGGPVFFSQSRAGKNMKEFKMWKFRSMCVDADEKFMELMKENEQIGPAFKIKNDQRMTKVGRFIRKFSIDELPQLFNILKGDMSICGPRPLILFRMEECNEYEKQRLVVQPGLTCYWQVSGRSNVQWDRWVEMDLDYIEDMNLFLDLILILRTIPVVLSGEGAY